jgi:hypothetical protein
MKTRASKVSKGIETRWKNDEDEEKMYRDYNDQNSVFADDDEIENRFHHYHKKYISYM